MLVLFASKKFIYNDYNQQIIYQQIVGLPSPDPPYSKPADSKIWTYFEGRILEALSSKTDIKIWASKKTKKLQPLLTTLEDDRKTLLRTFHA